MGEVESVSPDGLSKIDDFILPAFPFIFRLPPSLPVLILSPLPGSVAEADNARKKRGTALQWELVSVLPPR